MEEIPKTPEEQQAPETGGENYVEDKNKAWEMAKAEDPHREGLIDKAHILKTLGIEDTTKILEESKSFAEKQGEEAGVKYENAKKTAESYIRKMLQENLTHVDYDLSRSAMSDSIKDEDFNKVALRDILFDNEGKEKIPGLNFNIVDLDGRNYRYEITYSKPTA